MKRPLSLVLVAACLISACSSTPKTESQTETAALASNILDARAGFGQCGPSEVKYCSVSGTRIASSRLRGQDCTCVPAEAIRNALR